MNIGNSLIQAITVNSNIFPSQMIIKYTWGSWDWPWSWREESCPGCMHTNSLRCPLHRTWLLGQGVLIWEQQQLYSFEAAPPQVSKAKAARPSDAEEKWKPQKFNLIQKSKMLLMFVLKTRDSSDFTQLNFTENCISNFKLWKQFWVSVIHT